MYVLIDEIYFVVFHTVALLSSNHTLRRLYEQLVPTKVMTANEFWLHYNPHNTVC